MDSAKIEGRRPGRGRLRCAAVLFALVSACAGAERDEPSAVDGSLSLPRLTDLDPAEGVVEVELVATEGEVEYLRGQPARVWVYRDGAAVTDETRVPGPVLVARVGDRVIVHFRNQLQKVATTVHFHGVRLPSSMDGSGADSPFVFPGESFDYEFTARDAGTFWYHPHVRADVQIEKGLYGAIVIRGDDERDNDPAERIFVLDDVKLDGEGRLANETTMLDVTAGRQGNVLLVNGRADGTLHAQAGSRERWRLINAANGRFFDLKLPGHPFTVIGWDGGLLEEPYETETLRMAPGERFDVLVTLSGMPGSRMTLLTLPVDSGHGVASSALSLMTVALDAALAARQASVPPPKAVPETAVNASTPVRGFELTEDHDAPNGPLYAINGESWPFNTTMSGSLGETEVWQIHNDAEGEHPFHLHGAFFQVLDQDGTPPPHRGWKDTVGLPGGSTVRLAVRYDAPGGWMFHCQIPEHAERGMMGEIRIAGP